MSCIGLLEDLHRFADGLQKRNENSYYKEGPYIVFNSEVSKQGILNDQILGGRLNNLIKSQINKSKSKHRSDGDQLSELISKKGMIDIKSQQSGLRNQVILSENSQNQYIDFANPLSQFKKGGLYDEKTKSEFFGDDHEENSIFSRPKSGLKSTRSMKVQQNDGMTHTFAFGQNKFERTGDTLLSDINGGGCTVSLDEVKRIVQLLVYLDMPKVIERENWDSGTWTQFSDGYIYFSI